MTRAQNTLDLMVEKKTFLEV